MHATRRPLRLATLLAALSAAALAAGCDTSTSGPPSANQQLARRLERAVDDADRVHNGVRVALLKDAILAVREANVTPSAVFLTVGGVQRSASALAIEVQTRSTSGTRTTSFELLVWESDGEGAVLLLDTPTGGTTWNAAFGEEPTTLWTGSGPATVDRHDAGARCGIAAFHGVDMTECRRISYDWRIPTLSLARAPSALFPDNTATGTRIVAMSSQSVRGIRFTRK